MDKPAGSRKHALDPIDRVTEVLFGLIMVLTFTRSLSIAEANRTEVRTMLLGALGCNLAWGIIDGVFYLMSRLSERGRGLLALRGVRQSNDPQAAQRLIADELPPMVASILQPAELESMRRRLKELPEPPAHARMTKDDLMGAASVFVLVFLSTFPVVIPFTFMSNVALALRVSTGIAMAMLFLVGYALGKMTGRPPALVGISMVALGAILVYGTIVLGG